MKRFFRVLALAAVVVGSTCAEGGQKRQKPEAERHPPTNAETRRAMIDPMPDGQLLLRPTFVSCSVCWGCAKPREGLALEFREAKADATWRAAPMPPYFAETGDYRGSIMGLKEDTVYEARFRADGETLASGTFRTWASDVPVARTVTVDPAKVKLPVRISCKGSPDGWIRYTVKPGAVITNTTAVSATFVVGGASYVLIDDVTMVGGAGRHVIQITNSVAVRIRNCDISGWGRVGDVRYDQGGQRYMPKASSSSRWGINGDGAIRVGRGNSEIVVERCWIHDPNGTANSWRYSHPAGPEAVVMARPDHSTVIRWCDFTGSDQHRWNDAVESNGNFIKNGGFNRDADVYGNFMVFCNDDCIELDGGQQNVRCFGNRFEGALCGVSIQGCMAGPSYVHDNANTGMGDEFGEAGQTLKTSSYDLHGTGPWSSIASNLFWGAGSGLGLSGSGRKARYDVRGNVFCKGQRLSGVSTKPTCVVADNVLDAEIPETALDASYPNRPVGFVLDRARISGVKVSGAAASPATVTFTAKSTGAADVRFAVKKNRDFDWFDVSPSEGVVPAGGEVRFTVTFLPERMVDRRHWRGAFLVRTPEGMSRPLSLYAERTDFIPPFACEGPESVAIYADVPRAGMVVAPKEGARVFSFDVKKAGRYYFMMRARGTHGTRFLAGVDGAAMEPAPLQGNPDYPTWSIVAPGKSLWAGRVMFYDFKPGRHELQIKAVDKPLQLEGMVLTDDPGRFEPR